MKIESNWLGFILLVCPFADEFELSSSVIFTSSVDQNRNVYNQKNIYKENVKTQEV